MKHPPYEVLQDYFENVLNSMNESRVKKHLAECDQCTSVLAQFASIETKVKTQQQVQVSANTTKRILNDAHALMAARAQRKQKLETHLQEWKEIIFPQIKIPALQLSSLALVLVVVIAAEKGQGGPEDMFEPLNDEVHVVTSLEE